MKNNILLLLALSVIFLATACQPKEETIEKETFRPVRFSEVKFDEGQKTRTFSGLARASAETKLSFKIAGTLAFIKAKVGQEVRAGQFIAAIDPSDYELQYEEADAAVKMADAQEKNAKSNYERVSILYENESISLSEYESARAAFNSAKAQEKSAKQRRKLAKAQLSYTRLLAPVNGIIAEVMAEENENISPGQPILLLDSGSDIEVAVSIPESFIGAINRGDEASVRFSAIEGQTYRGRATEVAFSSGRTHTTYPVTIKITNNDGKIRPGMAAEVDFILTEVDKGEKIVVPAKSVSEDRSGRFVYILEEVPDAVFAVVRRKDVKIGQLTDNGIEILEGVEEGEKVVTAGVSQVKDGMKVKATD